MITPDRILANKRYKIADSLIPDELRNGRILDLGCGNVRFLENIEFMQKYGIDKHITWFPYYMYKSLHLHNGDITKVLVGFKDDFFDVVTMLAVIEHIDIDKVESTFKEIYRILKPNGRFILTTPSPKSKWIIKLLHWDEGHKKYYDIHDIVCKIYKIGFYPLYSGYFEFGLNQWLYAEK